MQVTCFIAFHSLSCAAISLPSSLIFFLHFLPFSLLQICFVIPLPLASYLFCSLPVFFYPFNFCLLILFWCYLLCLHLLLSCSKDFINIPVFLQPPLTLYLFPSILSTYYYHSLICCYMSFFPISYSFVFLKLYQLAYHFSYIIFLPL